MLPNPIAFTELCSSIRCRGFSACCLALCMLGLAFSVGAQDAASPRDPRDVMRHHPVIPPHGAGPAAEALRLSTNAPQAAPASTPKEIVLHNFVSPSHGSYPAVGVIRDFAGNLYGTTNGAYSDIGGGGTNNAGVVFKLD